MKKTGSQESIHKKTKQHTTGTEEKTDVEQLAERQHDAAGYDRREKIAEAINKIYRYLPAVAWGINTIPLWFALLLISGLAVIVTLPVSLIIWFIIGDRPVRRMQPSNFFYMIFRGQTDGMEANYEEMPLDLEREPPFMRMLFQMSVDLRFFSEDNYRALFNYYLLGREHPATGLKCYLHIRLLALALYGLVTLPYILIIMKIVSCNSGIRPESERFEKI